jgi:hypothetical protein
VLQVAEKEEAEERARVVALRNKMRRERAQLQQRLHSWTDETPTGRTRRSSGSRSERSRQCSRKRSRSDTDKFGRRTRR